VDTRYLERAVATLREVEDVPDQLLTYLSPLGWEHVDVTGDHVWSNQHGVGKHCRIKTAPPNAGAQPPSRMTSWLCLLIRQIQMFRAF
jgi:Tn3 transposase DDE domain